MPYCNFKTNIKVENKKELGKALTAVIELIPGKTERLCGYCHPTGGGLHNIFIDYKQTPLPGGVI